MTTFYNSSFQQGYTDMLRQEENNFKVDTKTDTQGQKGNDYQLIRHKIPLFENGMTIRAYHINQLIKQIRLTVRSFHVIAVEKAQ